MAKIGPGTFLYENKYYYVFLTYEHIKMAFVSGLSKHSVG